MQKPRRLFAHDNHAVGKPHDLFKHRSLILIGLAQNGVESGHNRHLQFAQQGQNVAAGNAAIDSVFMLHADEIVAIEIEELRSPLIRGQVFLLQFQAHLFADSRSLTPDR